MGAPLLGLAAVFFWMSSAQWPEADYDRVITYGADSADATNAETLTVVSYNIGYLSGLTNQQAVERNRALLDLNQAKAIAALAAEQPDLIGFQEIDLDAHRSFNQNQVDAIASALDIPFAALAINWDKRYVPFPYWPPSVHYGQVVSGQAILSRYPIQQNERQVLAKVPSNPFYYNALYLDRVAQIAEIEVSDQSLMVINVHLEAFDGPTRARQTEVVRRLAEGYAQTHPVLLIGDVNSALNRTEEGETHSIQTLLDSPALASAAPPDALTTGAAATFPADQPQYTLDYIFYTPATLELLNWQVLTRAAQASDHLPIQATFRLR